MKKSKIMKALLAFGMSMVTATAIVGFTACDEEHTHVDTDNNGKCDICDADMTPDDGGTVTVAVQKVELNKDELTLDIDGEETLTATVTPDNADNKTVTWTSSNPSVATVSSSGKVTAKAAGTATITATAGGKTATCSVTVNAPEPKPEVTEEEWAEILNSVDNFTLTQSADDESGAIKVDGGKVAFDEDMIYVKDGEHYYLYYHEGDTEEWTKEEIEDQDYEEYVGPFIGIVSSFKDLYDEFELNDDGVYVAKEAIDMTDTLDAVFENVQITFDNGKLLGIKFETVDESSDDSNEGTPTEQADEPTEGGGETTETPGPTEEPTDKLITTYEITDVGTTTVPLPTVGSDTEEGGITEEEWAKILESADNYTYTQTLPSMSTVNKVVGNKWQQTDGTGVVNQIVVKDGESYDLYVQNPDTKAWEKSTVSAAEAPQPMVESYNFALGILKVCKDDKRSFHYDDGKYTAASIDKTQTLGVTLENVVAEFDDGKLVKVTFSAGGASYEINSVGTTTVPLPTVGSDTEEGGITEEEWKAALSTEAFANFTATMMQPGDNTQYLLKGDLATNKYYYNSNDGKETYYSKEGDQYYKYEKGATDEKYSKSEATQTQYENQLLHMEQMMALTFKDSYSSFEYDGENDKYVGTGVSIGSDTYNVEAKFENGKLVYVNVDLGQGANLTITYVYGSTEVEIPTDLVTPDPGDEKGIELAFSNITRYGGANNDENVEMTVKYDISIQEALTMGADKQFDAAYINGTLNADTGWADEGTPGGTTHQAHLWLRGFKAEYDTKYVVTLKKGDTVVATGTLLIESPKSMAVSSDTENALIGNILTLNPEDVVMLEASITGKFPAGAAYKWEITKGEEYIELESDAETAIITAKAYSGESNVTAEVTVTYGVEGTTVSKVISVTVKGTGNNDDDPYAAITFVITSGNHYATQWFEFDLTKDNQPSGITYATIKDSFTSYKVMVAGDEEKTNLAGAGKNMFQIGVEDAHYHLQLQNTEDWKSGTTYNIEFYNGSTLIAIAIFSYQ